MTQIEGKPLGEGQGENLGYIKKIKGFSPHKTMPFFFAHLPVFKTTFYMIASDWWILN